MEVSVGTPSMQAAVAGLLVAMLAIVPLLAGTNKLKNDKSLVFDLLGVVLLSLLASQITVSQAAIESAKRRLTIGPVVPLLLLVAYTVCSYFHSPYPSFARAELFRIVICAAVCLSTALYVTGRARLQLLADAFLLIGGIEAVISLASIGSRADVQGLTGTFGTHETLGSFLLLILPIALVFALTDIDNQKRQIFAQIITLLVAAALLMSNTRSAWLGSAVSLSTLGILYMRFPMDDRLQLKETKKIGLQIAPAVILAAGVVLFVLAGNHGGDILQRTSTVSDLKNDVSAQIRREMAVGALHMLLVKPVIGWGAGSYPLICYRYVHYGDTAQQILQSGLTLRNNAHDYYLQFGVEEGVVGLAIYGAVIIGFFITCVSALKTLTKGSRKLIVIGCVAATAGQVVDALISPSYNFPAISLVQYFILGLGILASTGISLGPREISKEKSERNAPRGAITGTGAVQ